MLNIFEKTCADFIEENALGGSKIGILLAVSGGADSMALMHALASLKETGAINANLIVGHVHHHLRDKLADADADFVIAHAKHLGLDVEVVDIDVRGFANENKLSIETAARQLRRRALQDLANKNNCQAIATGHHKNDNAETIIDRLIRGTGIRGLAGIWPKKNFEGFDFIRPLLWATRQEIIEYLQSKKLKWCEDHTNKDLTYRRNFIRHKLLDCLQKNNPGIVDSLSDLSNTCRGFYELVKKHTDKIYSNSCHSERSEESKVLLNLNEFTKQPEPVKIELTRRCLTSLNCGQQNLTAEHYRRILKLSETQTAGRKIELPGGFLVIRQYDNLVFQKSKDDTLQTDEVLNIEIGKTVKFGQWRIESQILDAKNCDIEKFKAEKDNFIEWFDLEKIKLPLQARFRLSGDKFRPLGLNSEKKVGKFLTSSKSPYNIRKIAIIIADSEKIVWLAPIRPSELTKVGGRAEKILQLKIMGTQSQ